MSSGWEALSFFFFFLLQCFFQESFGKLVISQHYSCTWLPVGREERRGRFNLL